MAAPDSASAITGLQSDDTAPLGGATTSATPTTKHIFPFFKLPRELRDRIYGNMEISQNMPVYVHPQGMDEDGTEDDGVECAVLDKTPYLQLLQVSRQFKTEYEEEMDRHAIMLSANIRYLSEVEDFCERTGTAWMKNALSRVKTMELQVGPGQFLWDTSFMRRVPSILRVVPAVTKLRVICCANIKEIELMVQGGRFRYEQFRDLTAANFRRWLLGRHNIDWIPAMRPRLEDLEIEFGGIVLKDHLFDTPRRGSRLRTSNIDLHPKNRIVYHAKLSSSRYAWNGLELKVDEEETGSFAEIRVNLGISRADVLMIWRCGYRTLDLDNLDEGALKR